MLKARITAAKAQEQLQGTVRSINTSSAMAAFERMEEKVLMQESRTQSVVELSGTDLEKQFEALISVSDIDDELAALKAGMTLGFISLSNQIHKTSSEQLSTSTFNQVVDEDLEALRKQLDEM